MSGTHEVEMILPRRRLLLTIAVALGAAGPIRAAPSAPPILSETDSREVGQAVAYLDHLTTAKWRFTQADTRGGRLSGTLILQRPGKARFDYAPPSGLVVASDGHSVVVVDRRLKTIRAYPLGMTPLGLFLARNVRFDRGVRIASVTHEGGELVIAAVEANHRDRGSIALRFHTGPLAIAGWTLTDARGVRVRVDLSDFTPIGPQDAAIFKLADPRPPPERGPAG
jgi:outer membrane lipoprotein-sorting protein